MLIKLCCEIEILIIRGYVVRDFNHKRLCNEIEILIKCSILSLTLALENGEKLKITNNSKLMLLTRWMYISSVSQAGCCFSFIVLYGTKGISGP